MFFDFTVGKVRSLLLKVQIGILNAMLSTELMLKSCQIPETTPPAC